MTMHRTSPRYQHAAEQTVCPVPTATTVFWRAAVAVDSTLKAGTVGMQANRLSQQRCIGELPQQWLLNSGNPQQGERQPSA